MNKDEITADVAARLVAAQFPQWAGLPVTPVTLDGWDPLTTFDEQTRQLIRLTADDIDAQAATKVWDTALASTWERAPVWVPGRLHVSRLPVRVSELVWHSALRAGLIPGLPLWKLT
ncbi:MAG: hypothetical protein ABSA02_09665 [Trebonia sp.]